MHSDDLHIPEPCHADWAGMSGDAKRRFCSSCTQHVHDLSAMTKQQAAATLARDPDPCIRYETAANGDILFRPTSRRRRLRRTATAAAAAALLATTPAAAGALPADDDSLLARLATRIEAWLYGPTETPAAPAPDPAESPVVDTAEPPPRKLMGKPKVRMGKFAPASLPPPTDQQPSEDHD